MVGRRVCCTVLWDGMQRTPERHYSKDTPAAAAATQQACVVRSQPPSPCAHHPPSLPHQAAAGCPAQRPCRSELPRAATSAGGARAAAWPCLTRQHCMARHSTQHATSSNHTLSQRQSAMMSLSFANPGPVHQGTRAAWAWAVFNSADAQHQATARTSDFPKKPQTHRSAPGQPTCCARCAGQSTCWRLC